MKKFITFDLYGTLVDIKSSMVEYFKKVFSVEEEKALELYNEWNAANFKNVNSKKISFKDSVLDTLVPMLEKEGLMNRDNLELFFERYSKPEPFQETISVLSKLQEKYKLAIISNIDNNLIKNTIGFFNFDEVITAQDAGYYYKPQKEIFEYALRKLGCGKDEILHVAFSLRADVRGVVPLGWDMIWVNRDKLVNDSEFVPLKEVSDLKEFLEYL